MITASLGYIGSYIGVCIFTDEKVTGTEIFYAPRLAEFNIDDVISRCRAHGVELLITVKGRHFRRFGLERDFKLLEVYSGEWTRARRDGEPDGNKYKDMDDVVTARCQTLWKRCRQRGLMAASYNNDKPVKACVAVAHAIGRRGLEELGSR